MTSCNLMSKIFLAFAVALFYNLAAVKSNEAEVATISFFICAAGDSPFNGEYLLSKAKVDGAPIYSNHNDMSFFRNRGFW